MRADAFANAEMKTFTVRAFERSPNAVLKASRIDGYARIRARGGQTYLVIPEAEPEKQITVLPNFKRRRQRLFNGVLPVSTVQRLDKEIAGK